MIVRDRIQLERRRRAALRTWWVSIGSCAVAGLAGAGWTLGWPGLIAGAVIGMLLTVLALCSPELDS
jgi:hypothetical protein